MRHYLEGLSRLLRELSTFSIKKKKKVNPSFEKGAGIICTGVAMSFKGLFLK